MMRMTRVKRTPKDKNLNKKNSNRFSKPAQTNKNKNLNEE